MAATWRRWPRHWLTRNAHRRLIDPRSGDITFWTADTGIDGHNPIELDELDPDLVAIDPLPSWIWYKDMLADHALISDEDAGRFLAEHPDPDPR